MSYKILEGGTYYHHEAMHGARLAGRLPPAIYAPDLTEADLADCDALLIADRINPVALRRKRRILLGLLERGGTLVVLGENRAEDWAPHVTWHYRPTNFWWWLTPNADPGHRIVAPDHALFRHLRKEDVIWHYHGLLDLPEGARSLIDIAPEADPEGRGGSILYEHPNVAGTKGTLIVSCLDPVYHHGSFFMPASSRFLSGLLDWMEESYGSARTIAASGSG